MTPIPNRDDTPRGVVAEGPVGSRWARSLRIFRYEIRCWRNGVIPDIDEAVASPQRLTEDPLLAQRILDLVPTCRHRSGAATTSTPERCGTQTR